MMSDVFKYRMPANAEQITTLISHCDAFGIMVMAMVLDGAEFEVSLSAPLPVDQVEHVGVTPV